MRHRRFVKIDLFKGKRLRVTLYKRECWFSIVDIVAILTESPSPRKYWVQLKTRKFKNFELSPNWRRFKLMAYDWKMRETDCANIKGLFRIIQSVPSAKARAIKELLAEFAYERMENLENQELAIKRMESHYELKGYSKDQINEKMRYGIIVKEEWTNDW